ncbi:MAG: exonuclease domain-containing protein, partial [Sulfurimonadaceae bacterium]
MIILDFETNSSNVHDVIEVAAFRVKKVDSSYVVLDTFHRYYLSEYEVNPHALAVHKLSPERIERLRGDAGYTEYFEEDEEFIDFCNGATTLVAHNISFELRHLGSLLSF